MKNAHKKLITLSAMAALSMPLSVMATNGILPVGNGMAAQGVGGAGIANGVETMSAVDNPALASQVSNQWAVGASLFNPNRSANLGAGYVDSDKSYFFIPQGGWLTNINEKMDWGILAYAMGGMNTEYPANTFGPGSPITGMNLEGVIVAPTLSFRLNNNSSIGASLLYGYEAMETKGPGAGGLPDNRSDSASGFGFKLGYAIDLGDTNMGITYQTEVAMSEMDKHCAYMFVFATDCALNLPAMYGVGITQVVGEKMKLVADIQQVQWAGVAVYDEIFGWENQTIIKLGVEYMASADTTYRFGFNHGNSPIPDEKVENNALAPAVTESHLTFGMSNMLSTGSEVTSYLAYVPEKEQTDSTSGVKVKMDQLVIGAGYNVHF